MKSLTDDQRSFLAINDYEWLDGRHVYAKVGGNIAIHQSESKDFYIKITRDKYIRGVNYDTSTGVFVGYFKELQELFAIVTVLSKYTII